MKSSPRRLLSQSETSGSQSPEFFWRERFRDVLHASVSPILGLEGNKAQFALTLELSAKGPGQSSTQPGEPFLSSLLTVSVDERDAPAFLRLLGKRVLMQERISRASLDRADLESEIVRLQNELSRSLEREEALRSNFHSLVEGTRRLP